MQNLPTVTDKTTLNPSPTTSPTNAPTVPEFPTPSLYPWQQTTELETYETQAQTQSDPNEPSETSSTGSASSIDSARRLLLEFSTSGEITKELRTLRREFLKSWNESVRIEKEYLEKTAKAQTRRVDPEIEDIKVKRVEIHNVTLNTLNQYAFAVVKEKLEPETSEQAAQESTIRYTQSLKDYVTSTGGDEELVNTLVQHLTQVSGKQLEFGQNVLLLLEKEAIEQNALSRIANKNLQKEVQKLTKLSKQRVEKAKDHLLHELIAAQEKTNNLEKVIDDHEHTQRNLLEEIDNLKRAISQRDGHIDLITQGSNEANFQLTEELKQAAVILNATRSEVNQLQNELKTQKEELDLKTVNQTELVDERDRLATDLRNTKKNLHDHKESERKLEYELNETKKHLDEEITKAKRKEKALSDRTQQFKTAELSFDRKTDLYNLEVSQLKERLVNTTSHNTSLEGANQSLQSELFQSSKTDQLVTQLRERSDEQDRQISELIDSSDALRSELDQATEQNTELQKENSELTDKIKRGFTINTTLEDSISKLTAQLTQSITTNSQLDQQVKDLFITVAIKETRIRELQDEIETLSDPSIHEPSNTSPRRRLNFNNTTIISPTNQNSPLRNQSPIRNQSPTRMSTVHSDSDEGTAQAPDLATPFVQKLGELFSREEKKTIPTYKGKTSDKPVTDWLKIAERVAQNNNWDPAQKIRFFSDRLGGEAIDWHTNYVIGKGNALTYEDWKSDFIARFRNETDIEKLKTKLHTLKQKSEQRTRAFVAKLNELYDSIYGKERAVPLNPSADITLLFQDIQKLRNDSKKKILMKGLLPKIKTELWPRISPTDMYEQLCEYAYIAEAIVINKDLCEDKGFTAVIAGISHHEKQQDKEIEILRSELERMANINKTIPKQESQYQEQTIAVADRLPPRRSSSGDRSRFDNRVQFRPSTPQRSNSYSHPQGTGNHFSRNRANSLERYPPNRFTPPENRSFNRSQSPRALNTYRQPFERRAPSPARPPFSQTSFNRPQQNSSFNNNSPSGTLPNSNPHYNNNFTQSRYPNTNYNRPGPGFTPRFQQNGQRTITCYKCGKRGHFARECWTQIPRPTYQTRKD